MNTLDRISLSQLIAIGALLALSSCDDSLSPTKPSDFVITAPESISINTHYVYYAKSDSPYQWCELVKDSENTTAIVLAGNNISGPVVLNQSSDTTLISMPKNIGDTVQTIPLPSFPVHSMVGNKDDGLVIAGGNDSMQILLSNGTHNWNTLESVPFPIAGLAGSVADGILVFNETSIARYCGNLWKFWSEVPHGIEGITTSPTGYAFFSSNMHVYMVDFHTLTRRLVGISPIAIEHIAGDNNGGIAIAGTNRNGDWELLSAHSSSNWRWEQVQLPEVGGTKLNITGFSGNYYDGFVLSGYFQ